MHAVNMLSDVHMKFNNTTYRMNAESAHDILKRLFVFLDKYGKLFVVIGKTLIFQDKLGIEFLQFFLEFLC